MNYYLTDEEATLIRNVLHNERMQYKAIENKTDGEYYRQLVSTIDAMEHPEKHQPSES
jgi:hypothetical protein